MNILLIEDELPTARKMQRMLEAVEPTATVVGITGSVEESVSWLQNHPVPELILMDIELADGQSFEIFAQVPVTCPVIFATAYDEYAIRAFKVNSIDYLLKPVRETDLRQALAKLRSMQSQLAGHGLLQAALLQLMQQGSQPAALLPRPEIQPVRERFLVKTGQRLQSVAVSDIAYLFSRNKISFLKTFAGQEWMIDYTMDELEKMLPAPGFFRLNRQVIAHISAVDKAHVYFNGKLKVVLQPAFAEEVLISREKAGDFKQWLGA